LKSTQTARQRALAIAELASDRKAVDITIVDLTTASYITDFFVICTGRSDVHVKAVCEHIAEGLSALGDKPRSTEGLEHATWALLDCGEVVVHVFQEATRRFYDLERLWNHLPCWNFEDSSMTVDSA
jgi:ribosome-associated protein